MGMVAGVGAAVQQLFGPLAADGRPGQPGDRPPAEVHGRVVGPDVRARVPAEPRRHRRGVGPDGGPVRCGGDAAGDRPAADAAAGRRSWRALFRRAVRVVVGSDRALAPLLERFPAVTLLDSTVIGLPDGQRDRFPGCGGRLRVRAGGAEAADRTGPADRGAGARGGRAGPQRRQRRRIGSRRGGGRGRCGSPTWATSAWRCSRRWSGRASTSCRGCSSGRGWGCRAGRRSTCSAGWPGRPSGWSIGRSCWGSEQRLPCRLIAWRVPADQADRRRQKLRADAPAEVGPRADGRSGWGGATGRSW